MPRTYKRKTDRPYEKSKPQQVPAKFVPGFMGKLDQRTGLSNALRERFDSIIADLGGPESVGHLKGMLVERIVWLEGTLCNLESSLATTTDAKTSSEVVARWIQACNALLGIAKTLGIERQIRPRDLSSYIAERNDTDSEGTSDEHH
jgi:hypothetical protein